jgi:type VI secretion system Hcp family effector
LDREGQRVRLGGLAGRAEHHVVDAGGQHVVADAAAEGDLVGAGRLLGARDRAVGDRCVPRRRAVPWFFVGRQGRTITPRLTQPAADALAGRSSIGEITVTKKVDASSPKLFQAVATGKHFPTVIITLAKQHTGGAIDYVRFTVTNALVASVLKPPGPTNTPVEQVTLNFTKMTESYLGGGGSKPTTITISGQN